MGVVYKLTQDVISAIIEQKRMTPALGCRDIAKIVSQQLHRPVSKSSINAVLKQSQLSNPVGRRRVSGSAADGKKFEIPEESKRRILSALPVSDLLQKDRIVPPAKIPAIRQVPEKKQPALSIATVDSRETLPYAGSIFLRAIQREMTQGSILGRFLQEQIKDFPSELLFRVSDALIFAQMIEEKNPEKIIAEHQDVFSLLYGLSPEDFSGKMLEEIHKQVVSDSMTMKFMVDLPAMFSLVSRVRFSLESGSSFLIDTKQLTIWKETAQFGHFIFLEKALERTINQYLNNVQTAVLSTVPTEDFSGTEKYSDEFYAMLYAFENLPGKRIVKIVLETASGQEIVVLDAIPEKKRFFVAGLWPWQTKFSSLLSQVSKGQKHAITLNNGINGGRFKEKEIYFQEIGFSFTEDQPGMAKIPGRAIFIYPMATEPPSGAILTNAGTDILPPVEVFSCFLSHWPQMEKSLGIQVLKNIENFQQSGNQQLRGQNDSLESAYYQKITKKSLNLVDNFFTSSIFSIDYDKSDRIAYLAKLYQNLILMKYFPIEDINKYQEMFQTICELPGYLQRKKNQIDITLILPPGKPFLYRPQLELALQLFNEEGIQDEKGNLFFLNLA